MESAGSLSSAAGRWSLPFGRGSGAGALNDVGWFLANLSCMRCCGWTVPIVYLFIVKICFLDRIVSVRHYSHWDLPSEQPRLD